MFSLRLEGKEAAFQVANVQREANFLLHGRKLLCFSYPYTSQSKTWINTVYFLIATLSKLLIAVQSRDVRKIVELFVKSCIGRTSAYNSEKRKVSSIVKIKTIKLQ